MLRGLIEAGGKALGGARFSLLSILPSVLVIAVIATLIRAHLYEPGARVDFGAVLPGKGDAAALALGTVFIFVGGVILRPFEAALVQLLEGYWTRPSPLAPLRGAATERHRRRRNRAIATIELAEPATPANVTPQAAVARPLHTLTAEAKAAAKRRRRVSQARRVRGRYPTEVRELELPGNVWRDKHGELMATELGNALLRAERLSGDRYGLDIMRTYPRIYPFVSERLNSAVTQQMDLIASTASLCVSLAICTVATLPLVLRLDVWSLLPLLPAVMAVLAYRGAVAAALYHAELLCAVFDLHRFDLVKAFHYKPETNALEFVQMNEQISQFLAQDDSRFDNGGLKDEPMDHSVEPPGSTGNSASQGTNGNGSP
ncbi:hypothetical protein [Streptomyces albicerus]|uniref:hypothetical protein n=1 Tax=Streptomyces albicerus TaxID=2569859 RepID=UPI00124B5D98|nr:hypothetical protein [Streptomyces albicerus]